MSEREARPRQCLICGVGEAEVIRTRNRDRYTLECGFTEGYEYREFTSTDRPHRWADWRDSELRRHNVPEADFERFRRASLAALEDAYFRSLPEEERPSFW